MKVVVTSQSAVKIDACKKAFAAIAGVQIIPVKAASGIAEQPLNGETLTGAFNRIEAAKKIIPDADLYVSVENGLFEENGAYIDRAVVVIAKKDGASETTYSDGVVFPKRFVDEARKRGFDKWTVGQVMAEMGVVKHHDDPHLDLSGKSRVAYIDEALRKAVAKLAGFTKQQPHGPKR